MAKGERKGIRELLIRKPTDPSAGTLPPDLPGGIPVVTVEEPGGPQAPTTAAGEAALSDPARDNGGPEMPAAVSAVPVPAEALEMTNNLQKAVEGLCDCVKALLKGIPIHVSVEGYVTAEQLATAIEAAVGPIRAEVDSLDRDVNTVNASVIKFAEAAGLTVEQAPEADSTDSDPLGLELGVA